MTNLHIGCYNKVFGIVANDVVVKMDLPAVGQS